jgi:hypothetical protein
VQLLVCNKSGGSTAVRGGGIGAMLFWGCIEVAVAVKNKPSSLAYRRDGDAPGALWIGRDHRRAGE